MDETLSIGDWIQIDKYTGKVKEIGWRHTAIETRNWDTVFIPNARLMREEVTVLGRQAINPDVVQHRQWVYFNVDFRYAPGEVIATVERALTKGPIDNVAESPAPQCIAMAFEDSWVKYAVRYWLTDLAKDDFTDSLVRQRVYYALARADMPLSLPAQTLFLRQQNSEEREQHQQRELDRRLNALQGVAVFQSLTSDELKTLAGRLHFAPFAKSEVIMRQGTQAHWLYIINSGRAIEEIRDPQGEDHLVTRLNPGDVFGEMSLLTGAPRSATVVAEDPVTCYRLDPEGFRDIIRARPEIGEYMSRVLAERKMQIQEALHHSAHSTAQEVSTLSDELLTRIYSFFNLGTKTGAASKGNGKTSSAKDPGVKSRATGV
jgi:CRP-like cAMP-binding protein